MSVRIQFVTLFGARHEITTQETTLIQQIRYELSNNFGLVAKDIRIIYAGKQLQDEFALIDYGVVNASHTYTMHLALVKAKIEKKKEEEVVLKNIKCENFRCQIALDLHEDRVEIEYHSGRRISYCIDCAQNGKGSVSLSDGVKNILVPCSSCLLRAPLKLSLSLVEDNQEMAKWFCTDCVLKRARIGKEIQCVKCRKPAVLPLSVVTSLSTYYSCQTVCSLACQKMVSPKFNAVFTNCCLTCKKGDKKIKKCKKCKQASYCSDGCQKLDWLSGTHRFFCMATK